MTASKLFFAVELHFTYKKPPANLQKNIVVQTSKVEDVKKSFYCHLPFWKFNAAHIWKVAFEFLF